MTADTVPYPPGPDPEALSLRFTALSRGALGQELLLLAGHLLFLTIYLLAVAGAALGTVALLQLASEGDTLTAIAAGLGALVGFAITAILVKALFRRTKPVRPATAREVTSAEQPGLFAFLQRVADDAGADPPRKVFVLAEADAFVVPQVSLANLFIAPKRDLYLGLGLVNGLNLSELQAALAHEFGHFTQREHIAAYSRVVEAIVANLITGEDELDRLFRKLRARGYKRLARVLAAGPRVASDVLHLVSRALAAATADLAREREFHADRVAATVAGVGATRAALLNADLARQAYFQAESDVYRAAERKHYSGDIYFHQHAAADVLADDPEGDGGRSLRRERDARLKMIDLPAEIDRRTPWLLFTDPVALRRELTAKLLRTWPMVPAHANLSDPRDVQKLLEQDRNEILFDSKYGGAYDSRDLLLEPAELEDMLVLGRHEPWSAGRIRRVRTQMYDDMPRRAAQRLRVANQRRSFLERVKPGDGRGAMARLYDFDERLLRLDAWFHAFDRRVAIVHLQMARHTDGERELMERYRFQLKIQEIQCMTRIHAQRVAVYAKIVDPDDPRLESELFNEFVMVLRSAQASLSKRLLVAGKLDDPVLRRFEEGANLREYLLDEETVDDLPPSPIRPNWVATLQRQLARVQQRAARLQAKSLTELLKCQERIAEQFESRCEQEREVAVSAS